jgi:inner membrane protein
MPGKSKAIPAAPVRAEGLSLGLRLFVIVFLAAALLIPSFLVNVLVDERNRRKEQVVLEVADQWSGGGQVLTAPLLTLPYQHYFKDDKGQVQQEVRYAHFLPEKLWIQGKMEPEVRYRGIYRVALYQAELVISGRFAYPDVAALNLDPGRVLWKDAFITLGMENTKGLQEQVFLTWNQVPRQAEPGVLCKDVVESGISVKVPLAPRQEYYDFVFPLKHSGHEYLSFVPLGKITEVKLEAPWGDPSFIGAFLPDERDIQPGRFSARWQVIDLNRNFPQQWLGSGQQVGAASFGVRLFQPVDHYQKTTRTTKYAIMFIGLTFLALFLLDVLGRAGQRQVHPIQYLLIGLALVVFYILLLSLSEHIGFGWAYLLASAGIILQIALYTKSVLANWRQTGLIGIILAVLYAYLYLVLQLEDYALLIGSISLFAVMGGVMYLTRKVDWSSLGKTTITYKA